VEEVVNVQHRLVILGEQIQVDPEEQGVEVIKIVEYQD
jgi:hypothetical protein